MFKTHRSQGIGYHPPPPYAIVTSQACLRGEKRHFECIFTTIRKKFQLAKNKLLPRDVFLKERTCDFRPNI